MKDIEITVVGYSSNKEESKDSLVVKSFPFEKGKEPLVIIDGVMKPNMKIEKIEPNTIEKIDVLKGEKAIDAYGDKGKYGVIHIILKKDK